MSLPFLHKYRTQSRPLIQRQELLQEQACDWPLSMIGPDGPQLLTFGILGVGEPAPRKPGIFVYAKRTTDGQWQALYIGESANLCNRLSFNEIAADALLSGATDIHVLLTGSDVKIRRDLCEKFVFTNRPPLNEHMRPLMPAPAAQKPRPSRRQGTNAA